MAARILMHPSASLGGKEYGVLRRSLGGIVGAKRRSGIQDTAGAAVTHLPSPHGGPGPIGLLSDGVRELAILIFGHAEPDFAAERDCAASSGILDQAASEKIGAAVRHEGRLLRNVWRGIV